MTAGGSILDDILVRVRTEIAAAKEERSVETLESMLADTPERRSFKDSLTAGFGLIAEIKERAPSRGGMRSENVAQAPAAYEASELVRAISVLTNAPDFGMSIERLWEIKLGSTKPILRKEFIIEPYQVLEAKAFGADAILLMTQVASKDELQKLHDYARELGLDVLVECGNAEDVARSPSGADIMGINTRDMHATRERYERSREGSAAGGGDLSTDMQALNHIDLLPDDVLKIAESGIAVETVCGVRDLGYAAALVGSDLLLNEEGVRAALAEYEQALAG
jgi:indole-3-glycerol phosphate synthase